MDATRDVGEGRRGDGEVAAGATRDLGIGPGEAVGVRERVGDLRRQRDADTGAAEVETTRGEVQQVRAAVVQHVTHHAAAGYAVDGLDPGEPGAAAVGARARAGRQARVLVQVLRTVVLLGVAKQEAHGVARRAARHDRVDVGRDGERERPGVAETEGQDLQLAGLDLADLHLTAAGSSAVLVLPPRARIASPERPCRHRERHRTRVDGDGDRDTVSDRIDGGGTDVDVLRLHLELRVRLCLDLLSDERRARRAGRTCPQARHQRDHERKHSLFWSGHLTFPPCRY